jgi:lipopolysaccharide heptosyltransferase III
MKSLREIVEFSPQLRAVAMHSLNGEKSPQPLGPARWDWENVRRILIVRLRSIGDTVLTTPSLYALKRFLPQARVDILLEDWVAPVLESFEYVDNVIAIKRGSAGTRARVARKIRSSKYDIVYNLHGGTTATLLTRMSGAEHRVGYAHYQYRRLHNHVAPSSSVLWGRESTHSAEQQLALLGWTGVPVTDRPPTHLAVSEQAAARVAARLRSKGLDEAKRFALIHPAAAFDTKQWATEKFARVVEELDSSGLVPVAIAAPTEVHIVEELKRHSSAPVISITDLTLPEVTALAARARLFVGNDSGIAHIAAAVGAPAVVIFGSSNQTHWRPWATAPAEVVFEELPCQPCHGYFCAEFEVPECIRRIPVQRVVAAVERVLRDSV